MSGGFIPSLPPALRGYVLERKVASLRSCLRTVVGWSPTVARKQRGGLSCTEGRKVCCTEAKGRAVLHGRKEGVLHGRKEGRKGANKNGRGCLFCSVLFCSVSSARCFLGGPQCRRRRRSPPLPSACCCPFVLSSLRALACRRVCSFVHVVHPNFTSSTPTLPQFHPKFTSSSPQFHPNFMFEKKGVFGDLGVGRRRDFIRGEVQHVAQQSLPPPGWAAARHVSGTAVAAACSQQGCSKVQGVDKK